MSRQEVLVVSSWYMMKVLPCSAQEHHQLQANAAANTSGEEEEAEEAEKRRHRTQMSRDRSSRKGTTHLKHSTGDLQDLPHQGADPTEDPRKSDQLAKTLNPFGQNRVFGDETMETFEMLNKQAGRVQLTNFWWPKLWFQ